MNEISQIYLKSNTKSKRFTISYSSIGYFLLVFFFVTFSDTVLFSFNSNASVVSFGQIAMCVASIIFFFCYFVTNKTKNTSALIFLLIAVGFVFASALYHKEFSGGYISKICLFILGFSVCSIFDLHKIINKYQIIMDLICVSSLIGMLLMIVKAPIVTFLPSVTNVSGRKFYLFFFSFITEGTTVRNYGMFTEPSRFQAYINFSLILCLFYDKKLNKKRIMLLLFSLLTTYSTTGFITFAFVFAAFILSNKLHISLTKKIEVIAFGVAIIFIIVNYTGFFESSISKITSGSGSESYSVRYNSIFGGLILIKDYFLFGTGVTNANSSFINATSGLYSVNETTTYTNTIIMSISKFGIIPGIFYISHFFKTLKKLSNNSFIALLLFVAVFCMLSGISFLESIMFNIIPMLHLGFNKGAV